MSVTLTAFESGSTGPYTYTWSANIGNTASAVVAPSVTTTYTLDVMDSFGCVVSPTITIQVQVSPIITAYPTSPICNGIPTTTIICNGASTTYTILPSNMVTTGVFTVSPTTPITYTVLGTNPNGCQGNTTVNINAVSNPTLIVVSSNMVCIGSTATITASAFGGTPAYSYTWSNGSVGTQAIINTSITSTFSIIVSDANGCYSGTETYTLFVDNTCQNVWPGDANSDGTADNTDILELGLHYTQTGATRTTTNNAWQAEYATNWLGTITNGKNLNHSDCNGDGIINDDDTLAIYNNYSLTHAFKLNQVQSTNPALKIIADQSAINKGTWGTASVYLGDAITTINNVNGVAYTVNYDNTLIEQDSVYLTYQNSFINAGQNLHFRKRNFSTGALYTATTHTNNTNVSGYGKIAILHYKILTGLTFDAPLNLSISQAVTSNASGSVTPISTGASSVMAIGASVGFKNYALLTNQITLYPNPTKEILYIELSSDQIVNERTYLVIYNALGQVVLTQPINHKNSVINMASLSKGMYIVELQSSSQLRNRAKLIKE